MAKARWQIRALAQSNGATAQSSRLHDQSRIILPGAAFRYDLL